MERVQGLLSTILLYLLSPLPSLLPFSSVPVLRTSDISYLMFSFLFFLVCFAIPVLPSRDYTLPFPPSFFPTFLFTSIFFSSSSSASLFLFVLPTRDSTQPSHTYLPLLPSCPRSHSPLPLRYALQLFRDVDSYLTTFFSSLFLQPSLFISSLLFHIVNLPAIPYLSLFFPSQILLLLLLLFFLTRAVPEG